MLDSLTTFSRFTIAAVWVSRAGMPERVTPSWLHCVPLKPAVLVHHSLTQLTVEMTVQTTNTRWLYISWGTVLTDSYLSKDPQRQHTSLHRFDLASTCTCIQYLLWMPTEHGLMYTAWTDESGPFTLGTELHFPGCNYCCTTARSRCPRWASRMQTAELHICVFMFVV